jgi:hypothetical protein
MITIPEVVEDIVRRTPALAEGMSRGIINLSALARIVHPEVEKRAMKEVREGAIVMALNRLSKRMQDRSAAPARIFSVSPDLMIRSNLLEITFPNSEGLVQRQKNLLERVGDRRELFITITRGIFETTIVASRELEPLIAEIFAGERPSAKMDGLSSLVVQLPSGTNRVPGVYGFLLQSLAWEGINVVEVVSTLNELTIILSDSVIDRAFSVIKGLFRAGPPGS